MFKIFTPKVISCFFCLVFSLAFFSKGFSATYYVRTTGSNANDGTTAGTAWLTVTYAVATVVSGDVIDIGAGTFAESNINITTTNITLDGAGTASTIMDGTGLLGTDDRAFYVKAGGVLIKDMKVKSYNSTSNASPNGAGIRVKNANGTVTIQNVIFESNITNDGGGLAIMNDDANTTSVILDACTFNSNATNVGAYNGGAICTDIVTGALNLTLNNGTALGTSGNANTSGNHGGGIYFDGTTLTLNNASVRYNTSTLDGGGIYVYTGVANIDNATISNNTASDDAGAIYCASGTTLNLGQIAAVTLGGSGNGNTAVARGGAIFFNGAVLNIDNTTISFNRCKQAGLGGGGMYILSSTTSANIDGSTISNNSAAENVAGILADGGGIAMGSTVTLTCTKVKFFNNSCEDDGSAITSDGILTLVNCLIYNNTAYDRGAVYSRTGTTTTITNCTVANNTENGPGSNVAGLGCTGVGTTMTIKNTISYGNANLDIDQGTSATINLDYSDYGTISAIGGTNSNNRTGDPLFTNPGASDFTLQGTSQCLDNATSVGAPTTDINGVVRSVTACGGNGYDIGCYEISTGSYQYFRSRANGNWSAPATWDVSKDNAVWVDASTLPFSTVPCREANIVTIRAHTVTVNSTETADQLTIDAGGTLVYASGTLTIYDGTGTDFTINGTFERTAANDLAINGSPTISFGNGSFYKHNIAAAGKNIPTATWSSTSLLQILAVEDVAGASVGGDNQTFGNVTFNFNQPTGTSYYIFGNNIGAPTIGGNCTVQGTGSGAVYFGNATNTLITITGDLVINGGVAAISGANSTTDAKILQVNANFSMIGGRLDIAKRTAGSGFGTFRLKGHFSMTGGSMEEGNINTAAVEFNQTSGATQNVTFSSATIAGIVAFTVKANAVVNLGFTVLTASGSSTFTTEAGATLKMSDPVGITSSGASGNIQFTGARTFNSGTNYEYNNNAGDELTGNGLPTTLTGNLIINNTAPNGRVSLSQATTLNGALILTAGRFVTSSGNLLTLGTASSSSGGSTTCYIDGPVKRNFNSTSEFIFPVGKNGQFSRCSITPTSTNAESWTVEYFDVAPSNTTSFGAGVNHVSKTQYWQIDRTGTAADAQVKLFWDAGSGFQGIDDYTQLLVCRWNGATWDKAGGSATANGSNSAGTVISGTVISFSPFTLGSATVSNPLPIELISFGGEKIDNRVELTWGTSSEINNDYFTIERSNDAVHFEAIATVEGSGNTVTPVNYNYVDSNPLPGISYYRLKQTDYNGHCEVAGDVFSVLFDDVEKNIGIYPNPCTLNDDLFLSRNNQGICSNAVLKICNSEGYIVYQNKIDLSQCLSVNLLPFRLSSLEHSISSGLYKIIIYTDDKILSTSLLISKN